MIDKERRRKIPVVAVASAAPLRVGMADLASIRSNVGGMNLGVRRRLSEADGWGKNGHQAKKRPDTADRVRAKKEETYSAEPRRLALIHTGRDQ